MQALASGDADRAEQLIQRAAQMATAAREAGSPGVRAATLLVYSLISDRFEACEVDEHVLG